MSFLAGRYKVCGILGQGGAGAVYRVEDQKLNGKRWAVKLVPPARSEWIKLSALDHPGLPHISDYFEEGGDGYIVMEHIAGETLQHRFERLGRRIELKELLDYSLQLCDVLSYLHEQQPHPIVHRDLKPSNIMIDVHGRLKLIDFGIARHYKRDALQDTQRIGTIGFAAPELVDHGRTSPRSDLYSFGAVLHYVISGGNSCYSPQASLNGACPDSLQRVIAKLLSYDENERYAAAAQLKQELNIIFNKLTDSTNSTYASMPIAAGGNATRCMIVVAGLLEGAGSSTVALLMSESLRRYAVPHAVIEQPGAEPRLYKRLHGEQEAPADYEFTVERIARNGRPASAVRWEWLGTTWHPLPPDGKLEWNMERQLRLLYELSSDICFVDASHRWEDHTSEALLQCADHIVVVMEPGRRDMRGLAGQRLERVERWLNEGRSVHLVANRYAPFSRSSEWLSGLPDIPCCFIPEYDRRLVLEAEWSNDIRGLQRHLCDNETMERLMPLMRMLLPNVMASSRQTARIPWSAKIRTRIQNAIQRSWA